VRCAHPCYPRRLADTCFPDALRREVKELTQALSSSRSYIASLEASIRGTDSGVASDNETTGTETARKKGNHSGSLGLGLPSSLLDVPSSSEGGDLLPPISGITGLVPLPHSAPMYNLRRKASGQLGSQASDARAALALKLESQVQGDGSGGLTRKGVNRASNRSLGVHSTYQSVLQVSQVRSLLATSL
jgi:hypothetical protein